MLPVRRARSSGPWALAFILVAAGLVTAPGCDEGEDGPATATVTGTAFAFALPGEDYGLVAGGTVSLLEVPDVMATTASDGTFTIEPLPRRAQIAPIFGFASSGDYVLCAQNHFAPEPETGRHDGGTGLVLRFVDGAPVVLAPHEHGISAFGDHKACVALPCTDGKAVLFARNDGALHMWTRTKER